MFHVFVIWYFLWFLAGFLQGWLRQSKLKRIRNKVIKYPPPPQHCIGNKYLYIICYYYWQLLISKWQFLRQVQTLMSYNEDFVNKRILYKASLKQWLIQFRTVIFSNKYILCQFSMYTNICKQVDFLDTSIDVNDFGSQHNFSTIRKNMTCSLGKISWRK